MQDIHQGHGPLVSFIIPCYNVPDDMLGKCLHSILTLSLAPSEREIIVVDDGSTDPPANVPASCTLLRRKHAGLGATRNAGLTAASGQFIQFVDADDWLTDNYNSVVQQMREGEGDLLVFDFLRTVDGVPPQPLGGWYCRGTGADVLERMNIRASACCYAFRRSILGHLRFPEGLLHEDEEFTPLLMLAAQDVRATYTVCYCYRERVGSITVSGDPARRLDDLHTILLHLRDNGHQALARRVAQLTMDYIYNVMNLTADTAEVERRVALLADEGLFPLPKIDCTAKYAFFRKTSATPAGRKLLTEMAKKANREQ